MYAYVLKPGRGSFEEVCRLGNRPPTLRDPPPPHHDSRIDLCELQGITTKHFKDRQHLYQSGINASEVLRRDALKLAQVNSRIVVWWGRVAKSRWPIPQPAYLLERSAPGFEHISIHRLCPW